MALPGQHRWWHVEPADDDQCRRQTHRAGRFIDRCAQRCHGRRLRRRRGAGQRVRARHWRHERHTGSAQHLRDHSQVEAQQPTCRHRLGSAAGHRLRLPECGPRHHCLRPAPHRPRCRGARRRLCVAAGALCTAAWRLPGAAADRTYLCQSAAGPDDAAAQRPDGGSRLPHRWRHRDS